MKEDSHEVDSIFRNALSISSSFISIVIIITVLITIVIFIAHKVGNHGWIIVTAIIDVLACCNFRLLFTTFSFASLSLLLFSDLSIVGYCDTVDDLLKVDGADLGAW